MLNWVRRVASLFVVLGCLGSAPTQASEASQPSQTEPNEVLIENVTVIDGYGGPPRPAKQVWIRGDRIARIGDGVPEGVSGSALRIDARGKFAIPGLMDMHIHLRGGRGENAPDREAGIRALQGYLYCGITAVFDAGNNSDFIFSLREHERSGKIVAPRIFAAGAIVTSPDGHGSSGAVTIEDLARERSKLDAHIANKPDLLKITQDEHGWGTRPLIRHMPNELLEEVIRYYHEHGIRTSIHTSSELRTWEAIYAGVDTLVHPVIQAPVSERFLNVMRVKKIPQVSTLTIGEGYARLVDSPEFLDQPLYRATLTSGEISQMRTTLRDEWQERRWTQWMKVMTPVAQENLRRVHDAGGVVVAGTDQSLGPALHRELELLVDAGIAPADVIRMATYHGALFLGLEDELGTLEAGKLADVVLLNQDPTRDIDHAKDIFMVVKNGVPVDRESLVIPANASE